MGGPKNTQHETHKVSHSADHKGTHFHTGQLREVECKTAITKFLSPEQVLLNSISNFILEEIYSLSWQISREPQTVPQAVILRETHAFYHKKSTSFRLSEDTPTRLWQSS